MLVDYFRTLFDHGDAMINKAIEQGVTRAYMSWKVLVHKLGQLPKFYDGELHPQMSGHRTLFCRLPVDACASCTIIFNRELINYGFSDRRET